MEQTTNYNIQVYLNTLRQKGYLAYEYHPFHNYQTDEDLYLINDKFLVPDKCAVDIRNGEILTNKQNNKNWINKRGEIVDNAIEAGKEDGVNKNILYAKAGSVIDLDTDKLNFDLRHPVELEIQPSYDGSVNVILNDDKNIPRLINSRFSAREKNTYEIVDRIGENDTNIYNSRTFDKDTSLYFQYNQNPIIEYQGFVDGILPVGSYCFYFTYCDADDNESDIIAETGIIPVFIGDDGNPFSMDGGIKNQLSNKGVKLKFNNLEKSYDYIKIYYVRYFADYEQNRVYECKKIYQKYSLRLNGESVSLILQITGNEATEDIDAEILNLTKFNPKSVLTQAQCKNMLFFGNIVKNVDNYKELTDCALRIIPGLKIETIDLVNENYSGNEGYYNSSTIYNKTGYFPQEYYRFGVVFIYNNGTLSNVYNTLGYTLQKDQKEIICQCKLWEQDGAYYNRKYITVDDNGWVQNYSEDIINRINSKGVCKIDYNPESINEIIGIKFNIPEDVINFLKEDLGIRGLFFVRQKCLPTIIAQCYLLPIDALSRAPVIQCRSKNDNNEEKENYIIETFLHKTEKASNNNDGNNDMPQITHSYKDRLYNSDKSKTSNTAYAAICPDFLLNQPYYNQIFNGSSFTLKPVYQSILKEDVRRFYTPKESYVNISSMSSPKVTICSVTEDVPQIAIKDQIYKLEMGIAEEAYKFEIAGEEVKIQGSQKFDVKSVNLIRGKYSPYLAIYGNSTLLQPGNIYNICKETSINSEQEYLDRMNSSEPFYSISNRYNFEQLNNNECICYRGDCFINQFTYRLNRNFNDPTLPNNETIIDIDTWRYYGEDQTKWNKISRSDINAIMMGSWITFKLRSAINYALRSTDHSHVAEKALMGGPRSFYPRSSLLERGTNKMPDSYLYNDAYRATLGFKCYFTLENMNYIKDTFSNRIQYSAISIQDSFKNNYRESFSTYYRDYSQEYGSIQRLIGFEGYLLVVFEHAVCIAVVNERVLAGSGDGEPVFINTHNVLPEELTVISDTYGTQWPESVVKSEAGYVYGVDTVAKKIWRIKGQNIEILSDFKVNKFLNDNITLGERETYPIVGLRNVKSHYNNNKKDVMFTFYDDVYKDEEKVWNLCFNELLEQFVTFYSWVPSYSENIGTQFFTFNRDTAKGLSLLNKCNYHIPDNSGVLLDTPILTKVGSTYNPINIYYRDKVNYSIHNKGDEEDILYDLQYLYIPMVKEHDHWGCWKWFDIETISYITTSFDTIANKIREALTSNNKLLQEIQSEVGDSENEGNSKKYKFHYYGKLRLVFDSDSLNNENADINNIFKEEIYYNRLVVSDPKKVDKWFKKYPILLLEITPEGEHTETIALTTEEILNNQLLTSEEKDKPNLSTDFYLHGQAGLIDIQENTYPTHWYGETHPFEFEFVVNDNIAQQKIFNNLVLIANKAEPESFHFEINGDNYDFSEDKRAMYFRQEATNNLYQNLGSDILYNRYYTDVVADKYTQEQYYRKKNSEYTDKYNKMDRVYPVFSENLTQQVKSTIFPLYYERIDTYNEIYHNYHQMKSEDAMYDFQNLSGSEISWNRELNQFNIVTHVKNRPIDLVGRLRGNSRYKEGKWNIQIPSIIFMQKNEEEWPVAASIKAYSNLSEGPLKGRWGMKIPPIVINSQYVPKDLKKTSLEIEDVPNIYTGRLNNPNEEIDYKGKNWNTVPPNDENYDQSLIDSPAKYVDTSSWTYRKEARIRDKWMKVRVRYSGKNLAIIHSLITLYDISYS